MSVFEPDNDGVVQENELTEEEQLQLAENTEIEQGQREEVENEFVKKRTLLEKTKIVRQTWSISEIYQKIKDKKLILAPDYQRREIWDTDKQTAFIESLYMEIMIPPIYVVEVPEEDILEETKYEVVDGKQRLTAIMKFIKGELRLKERNLEYYADIFGGRVFSDIRESHLERTTQMLSSILDIYVITANSPEFTKYDIFARLNKGAEKLKVNEIRRAIYKSEVTDWVTEFVNSYISDKTDADQKSAEREKFYKSVFSDNDIKRYEDYGRLYRSLAFYLRSSVTDGVVQGYNSRPREMINSVLQELQKRNDMIDRDTVMCVLENTLDLRYRFGDIPHVDNIIDAVIPFVNKDAFSQKYDVIERIFYDSEVQSTLEKSPATTSNVNRRLQRVVRYFAES